MATEEKENPYEGFGTGGKFRKRPLRRTQTTPYDRPSISLRNPTTNNNNKGWFSKVVDPAQRLITYSAHSLFSSLFRKRLPPPQSNASSSGAETEQGMRVSHQEETMFVSNNFSGKQQGAVGNGESDAQINVSDGGRLTELEKLLRQKTFTRSEIDHLTALMRSRTVDAPIQEEEKRTEVVPSEATPSSVRKDEDPKTPVVQNTAENRLALTPYVTSRVPSEDVASPAELAKAYMGSRPSKVSSSMLSGQSPAVREGPAFLKSDDNLPLNSPIMSIVPRTVTHAGVHENSFANPRTRGRSAIYSMARTPYARIYPTSTLKGFRRAVEGEPSSSTQSTLDHDMLYGSKQGSVKRRSSALYNDLGSVGPIRRIRHKANLYSRSGLGVDAAQPPSSSMSKPIVLDEDKHSHMKLSVENVGDTRASMCGALPSKSSEMASKILQQLDKLVSPKEKSTESRLPTVNDNSSLKLSPSMLHGQALRSMEIVDSSKLLDTVKDNRSNVSPGNLSDSSQKLTSQINKVENGSLKLLAPSGEKNDFISTAKSVDSSPIKSVAHPPQKKRAFHMSAHEDCLDLEDDVYPNGSAENEMTSPTAKAVKDTSCTEAVAQENSRPLSVVTPSTSSTIGQEAHVGTYVITDGSGIGAKGDVLTSMTSSIPDQTSKPATADTQSIFGSHNPASPNGSLAMPPVFSFANKVAPLTNSGSIFGSEKVVSSKEFGADVPLVNFGSNGNAEKVPHMPFTSSSVGGESTFPNFSASYDSKLGSSISSATVTAATDSMPKVRESSNDDTKTNIGSIRPPELLASSAAMTPLLTSTSTFTFGQSNGSLATSTSLSSPFTTQNVFSSSLLAASSSSISASSTPAIIPSSNSNSSNSLVASSSSPTPSFQFGSSSVQSTDLPVSSSGSEPLETKNMQDAGNSNVSSTAFGSSSAAVGSTGSGLFGFSSSAMTTVTSQTQGSVIGSSNGSLLNAQAYSASSGFATSTQTQSVPFGSSAPSLSFGLTGNTAFSSGNSFSSTPATNAAFSFGNSSFNSSSSATNIFNSGTTFGLSTSASTSAANSVSSNSGTNSALFGSSSWQPSNSSPFGSAFNSSSSPSAFGLGTSASTSAANSVSSNSGTNSALFGSSSWQPSKSSPFGSTFNSSPSPSGFSFGTSASVPSSSPTMFSSTPQFSFTSTAATGSTQPAFGNSNSVFKFGSAPVNNDQMTMEDSMAEDTVQAIPPAFGQQPTPFGAPTQSGASPFQFGSQQNTTLPNPSPFQASGSAEFSGGGGSFSLGTGGGDKSGRRIVKVKNRQRKR